MASEVARKLKIQDNAAMLILNKPSDINDFDVFTFDTKAGKKKYDLIFSFIFSLDEFTETLKTVIGKDLLNPNGYLYFAYPKKGNKQYKEYIGRDDFFTPAQMDEDGYAMGSPLKFNKMIAFNDVFTCFGLKHLEKRKKSTQPSQCVGDYIARIPDLLKHFVKNKEVLDAFNRLTPGYQRDWARYVYGVKKAETTAIRLAEMENVLKQGYKSIDLYKQAQKR